MSWSQAYGCKAAGDVAMNHDSDVSLPDSQGDGLSSSLREGVGQKPHSTDDGHLQDPLHKNLGGKGGHFLFSKFWASLMFIYIYLFSLLLRIGDQMNHKTKKISAWILMVCMALPSAKDYAQGKISEREFKCLDKLWTKESNWRSNAKSKTHDMGIPQRHMKHNSKAQQEKFLRDPLAQVDWGLGYIEHRYGTPCRALAAWMSRADHRGVGGWY